MGGGGGGGESDILVPHNLGIIPPAEPNFEHNTLVSWVTPESISSIIRQTLGYVDTTTDYLPHEFDGVEEILEPDCRQ